eukprot:scaffold329469_cov19-Prasinocladus_malaysianus.AAC.1
MNRSNNLGRTKQNYCSDYWVTLQQIIASSAEGGIDGIDNVTGHLPTLCPRGPATRQNTRGA